MRHGDEQAQVLEWAYGRLSGDAALAALLGVPLADLPSRVWADVAPAGTGSPWVVLSATEALDVLGLGATPRLVTTVPLNVRAVAQTEDPGALAPIARRLYALLHGNHNASVSGGGTVLTALRTTVLDYPDSAGGVPYRHSGGIYQVQVN